MNSTMIVVHKQQSLVYDNKVFKLESVTLISWVAYSTYQIIMSYTLSFNLLKITLSSSNATFIT